MSPIKNSSNSSGGGNTNSPPLSKVKQVIPSKRWCFTLNNFTEEQVSSIVPIFSKFCKIAFFAKETGESGTEHLQGYVEFSIKQRPLNIHLGLKAYGCHWEKARGNLADNIKYCSKEGKFVWSKGIPKPIRLITPDRPWQKEILEKIAEEPDDRSIHWYWDPVGGVGKTSMCKFLAVQAGALVLGGKASDIRNAICTHVEANGETPGLVVVNIPRSFDPSYLNYEGFENIKDMCFYSGKYEGGMVVGNPPHLFIFSNTRPDTSKMSEDRWKIVEIRELRKFH